jgi:hypothetical protein
MKQTLVLGAAIFSAAVLSTGCEAILENSDYLDAFTCAVVPYYAGDCNDPEVKEKVANVLENGAVEAQINCQGIAFSPNSQKFVSLNYSASRLQDGSCFSSVVVGVPGATGFVLQNGAAVSPRSLVASDTCQVATFHGPMIKSLASVSSGVITLESSHCATGGGITCSMPVSVCTGFGLDKF